MIGMELQISGQDFSEIRPMFVLGGNLAGIKGTPKPEGPVGGYDSITHLTQNFLSF